MKIDSIDEAILAAFQQDGRQSNREVARQLEVSEGTIRQRLRKMQDAGAIRFDVVSDATRLGIEFVAFIRASIEPRHLERFLQEASKVSDLWYVAAVVGRFNVIAILAASSASDAMHTINSQIERLEGVNEVEVRPIAGVVKQDFYEIVVPRAR